MATRGRPRKYGDARMDAYVRIPMTDEQKAEIDRATADEPEGMAAWARALLLAAAKRKIAKADSMARTANAGARS